MNKNIIVYIHSLDKFKFFSRLNDSCKKQGFELIFVTNRYYLFKRARKFNIKCSIVKKKLSNSKWLYIINNSIEVITNKLSKKKADIFYNSVFVEVNKLVLKYKIQYAFIFNGTSLPDIAITKICEIYGLKKIFFELANIEGKLFVDTQGVNAKSSIYQDINILEKFEVPKETYEIWKNNYIKKKKLDRLPPQAIRSKRTNFFFLIDYIAYIVLKIPRENNLSIFQKIRIIFNPYFISYKFDKYDILKGKYIFLPLQVFEDSQLVYNSNISQNEMIEHAIKESSNLQLDLVIKPHPAETNITELNKIFKSRKGKFKVVNYNSYELITNSEFVMTINSSIGLEALILGKNVDFFGKSIYEKLNKKLLMYYICGYLLSIDYFSKEIISESATKQLLQRLEESS